MGLFDASRRSCIHATCMRTTIGSPLVERLVERTVCSSTSKPSSIFGFIQPLGESRTIVTLGTRLVTVAVFTAIRSSLRIPCLLPPDGRSSNQKKSADMIAEADSAKNESSRSAHNLFLLAWERHKRLDNKERFS